MIDNQVTLIIPTFEPRKQYLIRALDSVRQQIQEPNNLIIQYDTLGDGAANTRNKALESVTTNWVAFLDDDDELLPHHFSNVMETVIATKADLVYPWYDGINQRLFPWEPLGVEFTEWHANYIRNKGNFIPITCVVKTESLRNVGGFQPFDWASLDNPCEDWATWVRMLDNGCKFVHHPEVTWIWHGHPGHTSGRSWKRTHHYQNYW